MKRFLFDLTAIIIFTVLVLALELFENQSVPILAVILPGWAIGVCAFLLSLFMLEILAKLLAISFIWPIISKSRRDKSVLAIALTILCFTLFLPLEGGIRLGNLALVVPVLGAVTALLTLRLLGTAKLSTQARFFRN